MPFLYDTPRNRPRGIPAIDALRLQGGTSR